MTLFFEVLRWINLAIAFWVILRMIEARIRYWKNYIEYQRMTWNVILGASVTALVASLENLVQENPGGPRVFCTFAYLVFSVFWTYMREPYMRESIA